MTGRCERTYLEVPDGEMDYFDEIIGHVMIRIEDDGEGAWATMLLASCTPRQPTVPAMAERVGTK